MIVSKIISTVSPPLNLQYNMIQKQVLQILLVYLGLVLSGNPYTNSLNPGLMRALIWIIAGIGKLKK